MDRFWKWLFFIVWRKRSCKSASWCGARYTQGFEATFYEVTVIFRDTSMDNHYSREELVKMLDLIRKEEKFQNWKVPEMNQ